MSMRRWKGSVAALLVAIATLAVAPARALPTASGLYLTIDAPSQYTPDVPITVRGELLVAFGMPVVVEVAQGVPDEEVQITVDGVVVATVTTDDQGRYEAAITLSAAPPPTRQIRAIAFAGSPLETRSRTVATTIDRVLIELSVAPSGLALSTGGEHQLLATGLWDDGREEDLTERVAWSSSDGTVATVEGGLVRAHAPGAATITASYREQLAHASVTVQSQ